MHCCPTFVSAARLPSTSRPTLVRIAEPRWYSPLSYIRTRCTSAVYIVTYTCTRCRTSLVYTAVVHSYALLVCRQHRRPPFVRVAEPHWYAPLSYIRKHCSTAVYIADLRSYALHVCRLYRDLRSYALQKPRWYSPLSYIRTRCSSAVNIADLRSYALQNLVGTHRCPTFVSAARLPSTSRPPFVRIAEPR